MDGTAELRRLADLLRIGADTARRIATVRVFDADEIEVLAVQAEHMAVRLDVIAEKPATAVAVS